MKKKNKYKVLISETKTKVIKLKAKSKEEALDMASKLYADYEILKYPEDYDPGVEVDFKIVK